MVFESSPGVNVASNTGEQVNFIIGASNMAWPALASVATGMENLTAVSMRTTGMLNSSMTRTQGGILALGGASALALGVMTNEALKFQKEMALAQSLMENVTTDTVSKMNKSAKELAVTFGEMPTEVAEGFQRLGRAGVSEVTDQITLMTNAIRMAKIEGLGVEESTKILVSTVKTFGDTYQNAEHYANTLAHAANLSIATVKDLADSLKYFGSIAREHWSIEETTAAISTLATKGIVGQLAGTSLRSFTNYIIREMPKSQKALKQLGMQFDDFWEHAAGHRTKLKPLEDIVLQMYNASKVQGMTRGDFTKVLAQFGEPRMMQQYLKLFPTDEEMETGTWEFDRINKKMGEGYDIATRYNTVMATTGAKVDQLKASLLVLGISIGEGLLPILSFFVDGLKSVSNFIANNKIAVTGLTIALTALSAAALVVVANWGKKLVFETVTESVNILTKGLENLDNLLGTETAIVAKNTQAWIANSVVRNAGGTYPGVSYPERNSVAWTQKEAEKMAKKSGAGYAPGGMGFKGQYDDVASFMGAQFIADKVAQASKTNIPIKGKTWQSNAEKFLTKHYKKAGSEKSWEETQKNFPTKGFARQESIRDELYKAAQPNVNREMRHTQILENSIAQGAGKEEIKKMQSNLDSIIAENAGFAYYMAQFQNIAGSEGAIKNLTARQRIGNLWKQFYGKRVNYTHPEATYMGKAVGGSRMEGGMFALGSLGAPNLKEIPMIGKYMTGIEGSVARIAGFLPEFLTGLPVIGWIIGGIAASIGTVLAFHKHLDDQIESNTKKIQTYQKKTDELEKTATNLQTALDKSHPGAPGYFGSLTELNKTNRELDHMYDRIAATNREVYNAKAWQMGNWAEFRKNQPGPSWYSSIGTTIGGTLSGEKWKSGENLTKMLGLEGGYSSKSRWMSGPREYMFSEAYKGEKERQEAIANLNNAHNGVMKELDEQHKSGRFKSEQDYLSKRNAQILDYNNKRRDLDTKYNRQTGKVVGPENVDATRKMYQVEERLKQSRLEAINAIMKLGNAIMQIILLPLTILTGGAFKASGDSLIGQSENISDQINHMAKQMESTAKRIEDFAKKINSIANPILYVTYIISYFVSWMQGMFKWAINPVNWFTKSMPSPFPESYGKWKEDNEKGKDHRNPSELRDNALKRGWDWIATGKAGQEIYAGLADIPNKIKAGGQQIANAPSNFIKWITGLPASIWNRLTGPKEAYTPDDKRLAAEAKKQGITVKELRDKYMTTGEQPPATDQAQQLMQKQQQGQQQQQAPAGGLVAGNAQQQKSGSQVSPGTAVNSSVGQGKTSYGLHSPFTHRITQGAGTLGAGVATLIFPDLDPKKFVNMAKDTAATLGGAGKKGTNFIYNVASDAAKGDLKGERLYGYLATARNVSATGFSALKDVGSKSFDMVKGFPTYFQAMINNFLKMGKTLDNINFGTMLNGLFGGMGGGLPDIGGIFGKAKDTLFGEKATGTYLGQTFEGRMGGGLVDKGKNFWGNLQDRWNYTEGGRHREAWAQQLFGKRATRLNLETGKTEAGGMMGGIFGESGLIDRNLRTYLGKDVSELFRKHSSNIHTKVFGEGGLLGKEGEGDWKTPAKTFESFKNLMKGKAANSFEKFLNAFDVSIPEFMGAFNGVKQDLLHIREHGFIPTMKNIWEQTSDIRNKFLGPNLGKTVSQAGDFLGKHATNLIDMFKGKSGLVNSGINMAEDLFKSGSKGAEGILGDIGGMFKGTKAGGMVNNILGKGGFLDSGMERIGKDGLSKTVGNMFNKGGLLGEGGAAHSAIKSTSVRAGGLIAGTGGAVTAGSAALGEGITGLGGLFAEGGTAAGLLGGAGAAVTTGGAAAGEAIGGLGAAAGGAAAEGGLAAFGLADIWNPAGWAALAAAGGLAVGGLLMGHHKDQEAKKKAAKNCVKICGMEGDDEGKKHQKGLLDRFTNFAKDASGLGGLAEIFQGNFLKGIWDFSPMGRIVNVVGDILGIHKETKKVKKPCIRICGFGDEFKNPEQGDLSGLWPHQIDLTKTLGDALHLNLGGVLRDILGDKEFDRRINFLRDYTGAGGLAEIFQGKVGKGLWDMTFLGKGLNLYKQGHIGEQPFSEQVKFWKDYSGIGGMAEILQGNWKKGLADMSPWGKAKNTYADVKKGMEQNHSHVMNTKEILINLLQQVTAIANMMSIRTFGTPLGKLSNEMQGRMKSMTFSAPPSQSSQSKGSLWQALFPSKGANRPLLKTHKGYSGNENHLPQLDPEIFNNARNQAGENVMQQTEGGKSITIENFIVETKDDPESFYHALLKALKTWERQLEVT